MTTTAKVFASGRSQAIRLPKEFRVSGKEVRLTRVFPAPDVLPLEQWNLKAGFLFKQGEQWRGVGFHEAKVGGFESKISSM